MNSGGETIGVDLGASKKFLEPLRNRRMYRDDPLWADRANQSSKVGDAGVTRGVRDRERDALSA